MAREALTVIIRLAGQAPFRLRPLSSNVRQHQGTPLVLANALAAAVAAKDQMQVALVVRAEEAAAPWRRGQPSALASAAAFQVRLAPVGSLLAFQPALRFCPSSAPGASSRRANLRSLWWSQASGQVASRSHAPLAHQPSTANPVQSWRVRAAVAARREALPNPSLVGTATGKALGPRTGQCHHPSRGPSAFPASAPQLKR